METSAMHVTRWGHSGPRVLLVHGGAQSPATGGERSFAAQRALAERGWQLIVPDRPGHGRSPDPGRGDDAEADGALIAELIEAGTHVVGHSFGGCVALAAAVKRPEAVRSLTLIEPAMHGLATSDPRVRRWLFRMVATRLFSLSATSRARRAFRLVGIPPEMVPTDPAVLASLGRSFGRIKLPRRATLERQLGEIRAAKIPLLVVTGGWSPAFEGSGDLIAEKWGGQRAVVKSPHHFPQSVSDEFNRVLEAFMKKSGS